MTKLANNVNALLRPIWPASTAIVAGVTTREHVYSGYDRKNRQAVNNPYSCFNLADHVGDEKSEVLENRIALNNFLNHGRAGNESKDLQWQWLNQTHSNRAISFDCSSKQGSSSPPEPADAIWTDQANSVCAVLTADCLPILLCSHDGKYIAAIHAGWRGILNGIISNTISSLVDAGNRASALYAWLGPAIGPSRFEIGEEVLLQFQHSSLAADGFEGALQQSFSPSASAGKGGQNKYLADLYQLATVALRQCGVHGIYGGGFCTYNNAKRFYSYRRDGVTGRQLSFIFRKES